MWAFLIPALLLLSPVAEDSNRSFERLEEAGYVETVPSLLKAIRDDAIDVCGDAVFFLRMMENAELCPDIEEGIRDAIKRRANICLFDLLRLHLDQCEPNFEVYDAVYTYASDAYRLKEAPFSAGMAYHMLLRLHGKWGYDIFEFAYEEAHEAGTWLQRNSAFQLLVKSYSHRLTQSDVDRILACHPEADSSLLGSMSLRTTRELIEKTTFPFEPEEKEPDQPPVSDQQSGVSP